MTLDLDALIAEQDAALASDQSWLGSAEHLAFLTDVVHSVDGLDKVNVGWVRSGEAAYWEARTNTIALERPVPTNGCTVELLAKMALLGAVHETLHARFSSPSAISRRMHAAPPVIRHLIPRVFNLLEDGRITALGKTDDPGLAAALDEHLAEAAKQLGRGRDQNAATLNPRDPRQQLLYALEVYALTDTSLALLHPDVASEFDRLKPTIDATRSAKTDDCARGAVELVEAVVAFQPSI